MIKPLGDRVLIELVEQEATTASGIVLPDSAKEQPQEGRVVAVGKDAEEEIKVDDRVIYSKFAGTEVEYDGVEYLLLSITDILATIE
ncbi:MAG TPA: co-chaperone GroES [Pseudogracilibacillus sp.]|nr:co-chaperone GroES [Pseudogracilibacillus sp.]